MTDSAHLPLEGPPPAEMTIGQIVTRYLEHAVQYYRRPDGTPTGEADNMRRALAALDVVADRPAADLGPRLLKAIRQQLVDRQLARNTVNAMTRRIRRAWTWAASEELVPPGADAALASVKGLRRGRSPARETDPVEPVAETWVDATLPYLPASLQAMVRLQLLTGMRPGEICALRAVDVDRTGKVWMYRPPMHKTLHHGKARDVPIGPKAQAVLDPYMRKGKALDAPVFTPALAARERRDRRRRLARRIRHRPDRSVGRRRRPPGQRWTSRSYWRAVQYAIDRANRDRKMAGNRQLIPAWSPNQLRHTAATRIRRELGLEAARALLGQHSLAVAETYAELDRAVAIDAARRFG